MDFIALSIDETNTYDIKFCPKAIWLNVWRSRAKNTFIDFGIRTYLCTSQRYFCSPWSTWLYGWGHWLLEIMRAASVMVAHRPVPGELTLSGMSNWGFFRAECWTQKAHSRPPWQSKRVLERNEGNSPGTGATRINILAASSINVL